MTRKGWLRNACSKTSRLLHRSPFRGRFRASSTSLGTARKQEATGGEGMTDAHRWRGDGAWMRLRIFQDQNVRTRNERERARAANGVDRASRE